MLLLRLLIWIDRSSWKGCSFCARIYRIISYYLLSCMHLFPPPKKPFYTENGVSFAQTLCGFSLKRTGQVSVPTIECV